MGNELMDKPMYYSAEVVLLKDKRFVFWKKMEEIGEQCGSKLGTKEHCIKWVEKFHNKLSVDEKESISCEVREFECPSLVILVDPPSPMWLTEEEVPQWFSDVLPNLQHMPFDEVYRAVLKLAGEFIQKHYDKAMGLYALYDMLGLTNGRPIFKDQMPSIGYYGKKHFPLIVRHITEKYKLEI